MTRTCSVDCPAAPPLGMSTRTRLYMTGSPSGSSNGDAGADQDLLGGRTYR